MKPVSELVADALPASTRVPGAHLAAADRKSPPSRQDDAPPVSAPALPASAMRTLWVRMIEMYGNRWVMHFGDSADGGAGATWRKVLAGLTPTQVAVGLQACAAIADDWPPSAPRFRALCLGIPSLPAVSAELSSGQPWSPFTRLVWSFLDSFAYSRADTHMAERMLRGAYEKAQNHRMNGGDFPAAPAGQVEAPMPQSQPKADPEVARQALHECRQALGSAT